MAIRHWLRWADPDLKAVSSFGPPLPSNARLSLNQIVLFRHIHREMSEHSISLNSQLCNGQITRCFADLKETSIFCDNNGMGPVSCVELATESLNVKLDRYFLQINFSGNFLVGQSAAQSLKNL